MFLPVLQHSRLFVQHNNHLLSAEINIVLCSLVRIHDFCTWRGAGKNLRGKISCVKSEKFHHVKNFITAPPAVVSNPITADLGTMRGRSRARGGAAGAPVRPAAPVVANLQEEISPEGVTESPLVPPAAIAQPEQETVALASPKQKNSAGTCDMGIVLGQETITKFPDNETLLDRLPENEEFEGGTAEYFSDCSSGQVGPQEPIAGISDRTPSQRNIRVSTECQENTIDVANFVAPDEDKEPDFEQIRQLFCSGDGFYGKIPRDTNLVQPPKCDPTYPNSAGSRAFFMRMVNSWRSAAGMNPLA
jgi:hypothetical protein